MSILIKGMDMPHNCVECKLPYEICGYSHRTDIRLRHERHENCPLVEVKPPHGRLGDLDALLRYKGDCYDADGHLLYAVGTGNIMCAHTIIPAEEGEV